MQQWVHTRFQQVTGWLQVSGSAVNPAVALWCLPGIPDLKHQKRSDPWETSKWQVITKWCCLERCWRTSGAGFDLLQWQKTLPVEGREQSLQNTVLESLFFFFFFSPQTDPKRFSTATNSLTLPSLTARFWTSYTPCTSPLLAAVLEDSSTELTIHVLWASLMLHTYS